MVAAAAEAILTRHQPDAVRRHVDGCQPCDVAGERARHRVFGSHRVDAHGLGIDDAVAAAAVADDVVVEHRLHGDLLRLEGLRVRRRADQALLLAGPADEDQRGVELQAALREHPRQFHRQHRAAAVVVGAVGVDVVIELGAVLPGCVALPPVLRACCPPAPRFSES